MLDPVTPSRSLDTPARRAPATGTDSLPDLILIERSRAGDEHTIEALIRRYGRRLFRVARSVVADDERAAVIVQEAYLAAFGDLTRYEPTGKFAAWLTRLTYQQARLQLRTAAPAGAQAASVESPERQQLERAISALPEVFRSVFVLRVIEGVSGIETAACLGVHETTVRTRLFRSQRRLGADTVRRIRCVPMLMELPPGRLEQLLARVLAHLPQRAGLLVTAPAP